ncbi:MAG TPA: cyclopropane-fatty-acyl-phospholipid synthase family protein [Gemmataceae bacterium]|jgi:cyclopropane-fatty-acyl-phospholipid synthase
MSVTTPISTSYAQATLALWHDLTAHYGPRDFALRLWDGTTSGPDAGQPCRFTVALDHPGALRQMFWPFRANVALGEAYVFGDFDVEGDILAFVGLLRHLLWHHWPVGDKMRLLKSILALPAEGRPRDERAARLTGKAHTVERDRQAVGYHYDRANDFFALWLDRRLVYSCAYFRRGDEDIDTAQEQKLDLLCRKLRLKPGERLLDIGCGWGGLVRFAAERYGVEAVGITLSRKQGELARERIRDAGLEGRVRVEYCDYRELTDDRGFDKVVSVGMVEHVGAAALPAYFQSAWRLLRPGGVFLNHGIAISAAVRPPKWRAFGKKYVFPDGELVPIARLLREAEAVGFEVRDVENLREHYALTLEHWIRRLDARHANAVAATDEVTYRIFRLYMAGACHGFRAGLYRLHQSLLAKPADRRSGLPLTREDWYAASGGPPGR